MKNIKLLRKSKCLSQSEFAQILHVHQTAVSQWEMGRTVPDVETAKLIAKEFNVSLDYVLDNTDDPNGAIVDINKPSQLSESEILSIPYIIPLPKTKTIPLVGNIACGKPILAAENIECNIDAPEDVRADFALRCKGDSMINARINDGDIVFIRNQETVENGEIAAVLLDDEATLKRVYLSNDTLTLVAENPKYTPLVFNADDGVYARILGKAVAFLSVIE